MRVNDLEKTLEFYQKVFGLEVSRRHESPRGSKLVFLSVPNSEEEIEIIVTSKVKKAAGLGRFFYFQKWHSIFASK